MPNELSKTYSAKDVEERWYPLWEKKGYFKPLKRGKKGKPYVIVIPPPNVTGILHMGHALNNAIQDILIRWQRMKGIETLWVPGTDHAGIATQNVVEKKLAQQKRDRHQLGREAFVKEVWQWREEYGSTIVRQLRKLGSSCDWSRERFTMDEGLSRAVREVFVKLYEDGLIYQGNYIINWCPRCHTALSDEEAEHQELEGALYYIRYPIKGSKEFVVVATTRPETMLGDTGVAINPSDQRYAHIQGKTVILPLMQREIPVIEDEYVSKEFGTGIVKVTPAHDSNDFEMGRRHNLPEICVMDESGVINENGGQYRGMDRFAARKKIIEDLDKQGLFIEQKKHIHAVGHCYRCNTIVEPYYSKQWFVKMKPLAKKAIAVAEKEKVKFFPERWTKVYLNWMNNIRDWCISRQIWWGHQIPVWYCDDCKKLTVTRDDPTECQHCKSKNIRQDQDVLDTWFSSWLWPFSTLGWPEKTEDLKKFYPTSTLVTAPEILFFWVARMIMAGLYCMKDIPFEDVYLHGTVRDETGRKMSKSLGNIIDPLEIIEEIGADALRFVVISLVSQGQDVYLSKQRFEGGRNFTNKIWNAARFAFMNLEGFKEGSAKLKISANELSLVNQWILQELSKVSRDVENALLKYRFNDACHALQRFIWGDFCDWYLELQKPVLYGNENEEQRKDTQKVLFFVLDAMLRLLHPIMPFITEEIWQQLKNYSTEEMPETIMNANWPDIKFNFQESTFIPAMKEIITEVRDKRARFNIPSKEALHVVIKPLDAGCVTQARMLTELFGSYVKKLAHVGVFEDRLGFKKEKGWLLLNVPSTLHDFEVYVDVGEFIDVDKEKEKLAKELDKMEGFLEAAKKKLSNKSFVERAPREIIEKEEGKQRDLIIKIENLKTAIAEL
ncbi:MAG: valine--tRNA ligase [Candidatus Omnitrophica bacterium]|nr:valine--tRNA ligase [Candidatus Omnitrophota bacterium]